MDTALILKQEVDSGEIEDYNQASDLLDKSDILKDLLTDFDFDILNLLNRLTEISEIPFAFRIERVQKWINKLAELSFCDDGFSITGKSDDILSCYNSMITSIKTFTSLKRNRPTSCLSNSRQIKRIHSRN